MKKLILILAASAVVGTSIQSANAGDREWAVAGKVLTGLAVASVISHAAERPVYAGANYYNYSATPYAYAAPQPQVVYVQPAPPPVVVYRPPVYVAPAPVYAAPTVSFHFSSGGHRHHHRHFRRHHCW